MAYNTVLSDHEVNWDGKDRWWFMKAKDLMTAFMSKDIQVHNEFDSKQLKEFAYANQKILRKRWWIHLANHITLRLS